ncbi:MAG: beta-glucosidase [Deltaproteobacteria bacterium]|nr:beta-glucosidase [Deltaproteobacteria bacterium]
MRRVLRIALHVKKRVIFDIHRDKVLYFQPAMSDLHEKAAQLIVPRLDGNRLLEEDYFKQITALVDVGIGGFILFGGKIPDTLDSIRRLQDRANTRLLITSDIERGLGQQIAGGTRFPSQWA